MSAVETAAIGNGPYGVFYLPRTEGVNTSIGGFDRMVVPKLTPSPSS